VPLVLRKIRKSKWYRHPGVTWLATGDLQADALGDLQTNSNKLSAYLIEDDNSNLDQVVTALAANGDFISNLDYALLDIQALSELGIKTKHTQGETLDTEVNAWHLDLIELSAQKIMGLADAILKEADRQRFQKKRLVRLVATAVASECVDRMRLKPKILEQIDEFSSWG